MQPDSYIDFHEDAYDVDHERGDFARDPEISRIDSSWDADDEYESVVSSVQAFLDRAKFPAEERL